MASGFVIVPNAIADKINEKLEAAYSALTEIDAEKARTGKKEHYQVLLNIYSETGKIPDFSIAKKS